jgi:hypothetical protein
MSVGAVELFSPIRVGGRPHEWTSSTTLAMYNSKALGCGGNAVFV